MLVAFSYLYPRNKVEIRSEHYEYQTTEFRLKRSILILTGVAYSIMINCLYFTQGTGGSQHCCFKFVIDM